MEMSDSNLILIDFLSARAYFIPNTPSIDGDELRIVGASPVINTLVSLAPPYTDSFSCSKLFQFFDKLGEFSFFPEIECQFQESIRICQAFFRKQSQEGFRR